jgi:hypothetical protein
MGFALIMFDVHHESNMEGVDSNMYGHSDSPMMRARAKQLQSALTSQIVQ